MGATFVQWLLFGPDLLHNQCDEAIPNSDSARSRGSTGWLGFLARAFWVQLFPLSFQSDARFLTAVTLWEHRAIRGADTNDAERRRNRLKLLNPAVCWSTCYYWKMLGNMQSYQAWSITQSFFDGVNSHGFAALSFSQHNILPNIAASI